MTTIIKWSTVFLVILIAIFIMLGFWLKKRAKSSDDFLLAGRSAPFWLMACSYLGGAIGGASVSGFAGYGFEGGMSAVWSAIFPVLGCTAFILLFARRLNTFGRRTGAVTISDYICARYGERCRLPAAIISFFRPAFLTGMQYLAIAVALNVALGVPLTLGVIIAAAVILGYLITAGQLSALITQWIQAVLQCIAILLFTLVCLKLLGGVNVSVEAYYALLPDNFLSGLKADPAQFTVWFLTMGLFYLVDPWIYMWAYMGETPRVSQNAQLVSSCVHFISLLVFMAGMAVACCVINGTLALPAGMAADGIYSFIALNHSATPIGILLIVGLLMTIISCGSSFAMNGVTVITHDIYQRVINKNSTAKQDLRASRISVVIVTLFGVCGALWLPSLVPLWVMAQALALAGLLCPVLGAWFWKRSTSAGAFWCLILGGAAALIWAAYAWITTGSPGTLIHGFHACHIGLFVEIPVYIIVSLATKPEYEKAKETSFRTLGEDSVALSREMGENLYEDQRAMWRILGADTGLKKTTWTVIGILFVLHYVLVCIFQYQVIGYFTMWLSLIVSFVIFAILSFMGAVDLKKFLKVS